MKRKSARLLGQKFCQALDIQNDDLIEIHGDKNTSSYLVSALIEEAYSAGASSIIVRNDWNPGYDGTIYARNNSSENWLLAYASDRKLTKLFNTNAKEAEQALVQSCLLDYSEMARQLVPLKTLMERTQDVHITGRNTDLTFKLESIPAVNQVGIYNLPCGECFTAPQMKSVNGTIEFVASKYKGQEFSSIQLTYKDGRVVDAVAETEERTKALNDILDIDEGARYTGEFAIACNPYILYPIGNPLLDEKIAGSLHIAQGFSLKDFAPNENTNSAIHWDLVHIQRPEFGGGEIWFDGELIRKDGLFLPEDLQALNPENLKLIV